MPTIVILGAGQAALQVCISLRQHGYDGLIVLVGDEGRYPYQRPPLSKDFLKGKITAEDLDIRPPSFFAENEIDCHLGDPARKVDRDSKTVTLASGTVLPYEHLVFATGASNRVPPIQGIDHKDISGLRTADDAARLAKQLHDVQSVAVIGAGFIGLEFATVAAENGCSVTVIEAGDRAMGRSVSPPMAEYLVQQLTDAGVAFRFGAPVSGIVEKNARVTGVRAGSAQIDADLVLLCAGVTANCSLAADCGLSCSRGIEVDEMLRTSDPAISAIGDCAFFPSARSGARLLLESVQNATGQARFLAAQLAGKPTETRYDDVPWFWSEIAGRKLQIAGAALGADNFVMRGDPSAAKFSIFCYAGDRLTAVESINSPADHMTSRKLIAAGLAISPAQANDLDFDIKSALG